MEKINIMINGLPGNVAKTMARSGITDNRFNVMPFSLTGQEIEDKTITIDQMRFELVKPDVRDEKIIRIKRQFNSFITIDYTHPTAVNSNALFYTQNQIPFVMGTTGGNREQLEQVVKKSSTPAVIAPNMAKQIVGFQAMMEYAANTFPGLFEGYTLQVSESHQNGKADTSGTAKAMVGYFNQLGANFDVNKIQMVRDPEVQRKEWKIPKEHIAGHGWHTYTLTAPDGSALFEFKHNINGRDIYVSGTFDAVVFLMEKLNKPDDSKKLYTMIDVLNRP
ncbi:dihydrodipicolinate reductase [Desulfobacula toluolica]|uniref:4-hydroxy-tetrahydrodipicolinate reductase n=1 Tax=Desulfobacula toluolica (strain DSM 7467 / Tol2) TaxID=651182 RepID=K0NIQ5_DESTT|nr:dihydrodipicolinate reductase [Desulfobacula toluolica]CCK81306.1 DapB: dihydrodipicolinate reductase [Desulfobacula toluolica Tol2]